ncbi:hypothetical protein FWP33_09020 [Vibrio parahaemolyticus]|nr:hypothetical protein [Vibrio parahaemolyticus]ELA8177593.1 hypothetical protein [Vibrio alginolyticus]
MNLSIFLQGLDPEKTVIYSYLLIVCVAFSVSLVLYVGSKVVLYTLFGGKVAKYKKQLKLSKELDSKIELINTKRSSNPYVGVVDSYIKTNGTYKYRTLTECGCEVSAESIEFDLIQAERVSIKDIAICTKRKFSLASFHSRKESKYEDSTIVVSTDLDVESEQSEFFNITKKVNTEAKLLDLNEKSKNKLLKKRTAHIRKIIALKEKASDSVSQNLYEEVEMKPCSSTTIQIVIFKKTISVVMKSKETFFFDKAVAAKAHRNSARNAKAKAKANLCAEQKSTQTVETIAHPKVEQVQASIDTVVPVVTPVVPPVVQPLNQTEYNVVPAEFGIDLAEQAELDIQNSFEEEPQYG